MMKSYPAAIRMLLALAFSLHSPLSLGQSEPMRVSEEDAWARPLRVVSPSLPKDVPIGSLPVTIRVEGTVSTDGILTSPAFTPADGKEPFVQAIASMIPLWRFRPAIQESGCTTKESRAVLIVYFGLKDGNPSVSVTSLGIDKTKLPADNARPVTRSFVRRPKTAFPDVARQAGIEGSTDVLVELNRQGDIVKKTVLFSLPDVMFGKTASDALSNATVSKDDRPDSDDTTCAVIHFNFCVAGVPRYPDPRCTH